MLGVIRMGSTTPTVRLGRLARGGAWLPPPAPTPPLIEDPWVPQMVELIVLEVSGERP